MANLSFYARLATIPFAVLLVGYVLIFNSTPLTITRIFQNDGQSISAQGPKSRVQTRDGITTQNDDLTYFTSAMPFKFDKVKVKITYANKSPNQEIMLGFQDQETWHYDTQVMDSPLLNALGWDVAGSNPTIFQRTKTYNSAEEFIAKPPKSQAIGTYAYDPATLTKDPVSVEGYKPQNIQTVLDTPLRGRHVMYVYLDNEPFKMKFEKQDLNRYDDPDVTEITVYKDKDQVFKATIDDDGIADASGKTGGVQDVEIENPGPGLPEPGVYKIVIDAPDDSVITKITTNLHKIVFEGPIFPVSNKEVYSLGTKTTPTTLFTNSPLVTAVTYHTQALQDITVGPNVLKLSQVQTPLSAKTTEDLTAITIPKSDVVLSGQGYYAFTKDQYFAPTPFNILPIKTAVDLTQVDYVLTDYTPSADIGDGWRVAEREFDLSSSVIQKGKLSWIIKAPGLKENGRTIEIKSIEMTLTKKGWWKK